ncbi:MAG: beta-lactamase family protein, partial [Gammaproteobacteria bacterium]|nr:beta-lactamase family protein [Gammaproteobacteria bacterium]
SDDIVTPDTLFEAASLSKPVFAYGVWRLARQGRLDLDRPLAEILPFPEGSDPMTALITARHVLSHTSGLKNKLIADLPAEVTARPGAEWRYSGLGYLHLQRIVEHITGKPLQAYMSEAVFAPLGMYHSYFTWHDGLESFALGHDAKSNPKPKWKPDAALAPVSLHTTVNDYATFLLAVLQSDVTEYGLDQEWIDELLNTEVSVDSTLNLAWASGWALQQHEEQRYFFHWGANPHFRSFVIGSRESNSGLVIFTNGTNGLELIAELTNLIYGFEHPLFSFYMLHPTE